LLAVDFEASAARPRPAGWDTRVAEARSTDYETFAKEISLPMFRQQPGLLGIAMFHRGEACVVLTLWCDAESAAALARSDSHTRAVSEILAAGLFQGEQTLETCKVHRLAELPTKGAHVHKAPGQLEAMTKKTTCHKDTSLVARRCSCVSAGDCSVSGPGCILGREEHVGVQIGRLKTGRQNDFRQGIDHRRWAGGIDLPAVQILQVRADGGMQKSGAPVGRRRRSGQHGRHGHVAMPCREGGQFV